MTAYICEHEFMLQWLRREHPDAARELRYAESENGAQYLFRKQLRRRKARRP